MRRSLLSLEKRQEEIVEALASVLGNAGQMFGLLVHRGEQGHRWALTMTSEGGCSDPSFAHIQDCLIAEFVPRRELESHDCAMLQLLLHGGIEGFAENQAATAL